MTHRDRLEVLLKEWQLCQDNLKRHNDWLWQTGSIFIALALAGLWGLSQIGEPANRQWFFVFFSFSVSTIIIWYLFIAGRAIEWFDITIEEIRRVESELRLLVGLERDLLHTMQRGRKVGPAWLKARYALYLFVLLVIGVWILTWYVLFV